MCCDAVTTSPFDANTGLAIGSPVYTLTVTDAEQDAITYSMTQSPDSGYLTIGASRAFLFFFFCLLLLFLFFFVLDVSVVVFVVVDTCLVSVSFSISVFVSMSVSMLLSLCV